MLLRGSKALISSVTVARFFKNFVKNFAAMTNKLFECQCRYLVIDPIS
jgi:hypothetical protein